MKLSQTRFEKLVTDNNKDVAMYTRLVAEKSQVKEVYGFEEKGETVDNYKNCLALALEVKSDIESGKIYF